MPQRAGKILILGGGPTGIGAALRLVEKGYRDFILLEASDYPGGLAASFLDEKGFTWDVGGHVQFSHYEYFDRKMDEALGADGWFNHERASYVWLQGRFVPYPFQNNIRYLPDDIREKCLKGLQKAAAQAASARPKHFGDWALATFGQGIYDVFMLPYNFKVWAYPLEKLDFHWIGDRVSVVDLERVKENIRVGRDDVNWGPNNRFRFPQFGGTGAVWKALAAKIPPECIRYRREATFVDLKKKQIRCADGTVETFDHCLSTIPLDSLGDLTQDMKLRDLGKQMVYSTSNIVGVGLRGQCPSHLEGKCWMYFPENDSPFYRVTVFSHYSRNNVPEPSSYWSLMTETSESPEKPVRQDRLIDDTIQGLLNTRLISDRKDVVSTWTYRAVHGYPTPFLGRDAILERIHARLQPQGIFSRGRFGGWKYEVSNQDHSFMQGVEWVDWILDGVPEETYTNPHLVNRGKQGGR